MFSYFVPDVAIAAGRDHEVSTCVLHLGISDGSRPSIHFWVADCAVVVTCTEHYSTLVYDIIVTTQYTSRAAWLRNYSATAPLEAEVITCCDTSVKNTPVQLYSVSLSSNA